jgi:hypothetical protein
MNYQLVRIEMKVTPQEPQVAAILALLLKMG